MKQLFLAIFCAAALLSAAGISQAQLTITEAMSSSLDGGAESTDWWELTNAGSSDVNLSGYYWDDDGPSGNDGAIFGDVTLGAGESIVIAEVDDDAGRDAFVAAWGGGFTALSESDFTGPDTFSGLSSGGDEISLWDADPNDANNNANLVAFVDFPAATQGFSFEWDAFGNSLGLSVAGENGAVTSASGNVGSPGVAAVPEPGTLCVLGFVGLAGFCRRKR